MEVLTAGGLVVIPTDTVYGLAVDARSEIGIAKLMQFKSRPIGKAISVFIQSVSDAKKYVFINQKNEQILNKIFSGPYTAVLRSKHVLSQKLESDSGSLGIRLPDYPFVNKLLTDYRYPITATSANISGHPPIYHLDSMLKRLSYKKKSMIDLVVDAGRLPYHKPSTVVDLSEDMISVLRLGDHDLAQKEIYTSSSETETQKIARLFMEKYDPMRNKQPIVILLQGDLGSGKTQFVKGIGQYYAINNIISPSFVIYYEYKIVSKYQGFFYHVDLYNISEKNEFDYLHIDKMLSSGNIICIEWGEKSRKIIDKLQSSATIFYVELKYLSETKREITIC